MPNKSKRTSLTDGLTVNHLAKPLAPTKAPAAPEPITKGLTVNHLTTALGTAGQATTSQTGSSGAGQQGGSEKK